ncbi:MAG: phycobilisome linker polypeptide, partial [Dolichospermum sp.]
IQKGRTQATIQKVTVAYSSLSKKLQSIHRLGGKIINVSILRFHAEPVNTEDIASHLFENIPAIAQSIESVVEVNVEAVDITETVSTKIETNEPKSQPLENTSAVVEPKKISLQKSQLIALTEKSKKNRALEKGH